MRRAVTAPTMIEALRRLGAVRRRRTLVLGDQVYRVRRGRLVCIPERFVRERIAGKHRVRWGRGENGRMDWERQKQVIRLHSRSDRRHYSFYTKDVERRRRERLDRWSVKTAMAEWLYTWEWGSVFDYDHWDDGSFWDDDGRGVAWEDYGWSVTLLDLMR
jgi:hypothetical protein